MIIPILWEVFAIFFIFLIFFVFPFSLLALAIIGIITGKGKMHAGSNLQIIMGHTIRQHQKV